MIEACLLGLHKTSAPEHLQVVRRRGDALAELPGERFNGPRSLREEIEEFETSWAGCGLANAGDLRKDRGLQ